jgi:2-polyprenyl-3-methyl-5-hydroxy-6-metoxy-1,4-benzoquinol methylase
MSYVGVELHRLGESNAAFSTRFDQLDQLVLHATDVVGEDSYRQRLARAHSQPLSELDGPLAWLLNLAAGHRGYAAQADLWFNPPIVVELGAGSASIAVINERIVELPFAFAALGRATPGGRILDIGGVESTFALSAASLGYKTTEIDLRSLPYTHPNLESHTGRFEDWEPPEERFDAIFLISTIEHVGIGAYGDAPYGGNGSSGADRRLIERAGTLLAPGGFLVLTTPFGERSQDSLQRTYDDEALDALLKGWEVTHRTIVWHVDDVTWVTTDSPDSAGTGVAMLVASPPQL